MPKGNTSDRRGRKLTRRVTLDDAAARVVRQIEMVTGEEPATIANRLIGSTQMDRPVAYVIGQVFARLVTAGAADRFRDYELLILSPATRLPILLKQLARLDKMDIISDLMVALPAIPATLTIEEEGQFALGFYQDKGSIERAIN